MTTKLKINEITQESIQVYGDGLRELLHNMGMPEEEWDTIWSSDEDEHEEDAELQWLIGWFAGTAEALGVPCESLITLNEVEPKAKAPVKRAAAKKKSPAKKAAAKKKSPVKSPVEQKAA